MTHPIQDEGKPTLGHSESLGDKAARFRQFYEQIAEGAIARLKAESEKLKSELPHIDIEVPRVTQMSVEIETLRKQVESLRCPCTLADEPCSPRCSCIHGQSSYACMCCARYGDDEQRKRTANSIVKTRREWHSVQGELARLQSDLAASQEIARERYETILQLKGELDAKGAWIPVGERLPEPGEFFAWSATTKTFARWKRDDSDNQLGSRFERYGISHWQPLPEPPKQ